jgi:hypothetical protein
MAAGKLASSANAHLGCSTCNRDSLRLRHMLTVVHQLSRQAIKKYVKANNKVKYTSEAQFDSMFNRALKAGVEKGDFAQPKGTSLSLIFKARETHYHALPSHIKGISEGDAC